MMMTTVEPVSELTLQKQFECQEKLNQTNESFEPGKQFIWFIWGSKYLNTILLQNFRQQTTET